MKEKIFAGADLAWTVNNETGICIISEDGEILFSNSGLYTDGDITELFLESELVKGKDVYLGIDAPLAFPEEEKEYRRAERDLKKTNINGFHLSSFQVSKEYMYRAYNGARGENISKNLTKKYSYTDKLFTHTHEVVETFPTGITAGLFPEIFPVGYKLKGKLSDSLERYKVLYERIKLFEDSKLISRFSENYKLGKNDMKRKEYKKLEDRMDAFLCAFAIFLIYKKQAAELYFGDIRNGSIFIPLKY
jgi:predicted RNase H-like nuclease